MQIKFDFSRISTEMWICVGVSFLVSTVICYYIGKE